MAKAATRPLVYVADKPDTGPAHAITPARIKAAAKRHPGVFDRVKIVYGLNPKDLAQAEIVLGVAFDPLTL